MTDENQVTGSQDVQTNDVDYKALYEEAQSKIAEYDHRVNAMDKKTSQLLNETKAAKKEREEAARKAYEESQKNGEFEKLWQTESQEKETLKQQLEQFQKSYKNEKINGYSMKLAAELAKEDGGVSAKLLSKFLAESVSAMIDDTGSLADDTYESLKKSAMTNKDFAPLLAGSKASGGGAPGNRNGVAVSKEMSRGDFDNLDHAARRKFLSSGGKLI